LLFPWGKECPFPLGQYFLLIGLIAHSQLATHPIAGKEDENGSSLLIPSFIKEGMGNLINRRGRL
jgi:hypothetical protein